MNTNHKILLGIAGVVTVLVIGIGIFASSEPVIGDSNRPTNNQLADASATLAPDFNLQKLGGGTISVSEFAGKKPVILDFWASWCHNCQRDMPKLNAWYEKYKDQVEVIGVNLRESNKAAQKFIDSRNITFPIAMDPGSQASRAYGIQYTNTHFLISKEGNLVRTIPGDIRESDILALIENQ